MFAGRSVEAISYDRYLRIPAVRCVVDRDSIPRRQAIPRGSSGSLARGGAARSKSAGRLVRGKGRFPPRFLRLSRSTKRSTSCASRICC